MTEINIKFIYKTQEINIQSKSDEALINIFKQFETKISKEKVFYLYSGKMLDSSKTFNEIAKRK